MHVSYVMFMLCIVCVCTLRLCMCACLFCMCGVCVFVCVCMYICVSTHTLCVCVCADIPLGWWPEGGGVAGEAAGDEGGLHPADGQHSLSTQRPSQGPHLQVSAIILYSPFFSFLFFFNPSALSLACILLSAGMEIFQLLLVFRIFFMIPGDILEICLHFGSKFLCIYAHYNCKLLMLCTLAGIMSAIFSQLSCPELAQRSTVWKWRSVASMYVRFGEACKGHCGKWK